MAEINLKPCPFCGSKITHRINIINFFECKSCGAVISFTGKKKIMPQFFEAENPIDNFNRRADNG